MNRYPEAKEKMVKVLRYITEDQKLELEQKTELIRSKGIDFCESDVLRWAISEGLERLDVLLPEFLTSAR